MAFTSSQPAFGPDFDGRYTSLSSGMYSEPRHMDDTEYRPEPPLMHDQPSVSDADYKRPYDTISSRSSASEVLMVPTTFSHRGQAFRLLKSFAGRWFATLIVCIAFGGLVRGYEQRGGLSTENKHWFNALSSALIICLSLNLMASLNAMAKALKWRLLAVRAHPPRLFQLILAIDNSQIKALQIIFSGRHFQGLKVICIIWLSICFLAQVATAALGLAYSMDAQTGLETSSPLSAMDTGRTADFSVIRGTVPLHGKNMNHESSDQKLADQAEAAYDFGVGALYLNETDMDSTAQDFNHIYYDKSKGQFRLQVTDYSSDPTADDSFNIASERVIYNNASCDKLHDYSVWNISNSTGLLFTASDGSMQSLLIQTLWTEGTLYLLDKEAPCGPRCSQLYALVTVAQNSTKNSTEFYQCRSEVMPVVDIDTGAPIARPELQLNDTQAQIIAGSIGSQGIQVFRDDSISNQTNKRSLSTGSSNPKYLDTDAYNTDSFSTGSSNTDSLDTNAQDAGSFNAHSSNAGESGSHHAVIYDSDTSGSDTGSSDTDNIEADFSSYRFSASFFYPESQNSPGKLNSTFARYVAAFSASVLAVMNHEGPKQVVNDILVRQDASELHVHWKWVILDLALIAGIQALLALLTIGALYYYRTVVHDDTPFAIAALLGPSVAHVPSGTLKNGNAISDTIQPDLVYTYLPSDSPNELRSVAVNDVHFGRYDRFPDGKYV